MYAIVDLMHFLWERLEVISNTHKQISWKLLWIGTDTGMWT